MMLLIVLTLIGVTGVSLTVMQEKMTQNLRDLSTATNAAEAALGDGEKWLAAQTSAPTPVSTCSTPPCQVWTLGGITIQNTNTWWQANGRPLSTNDFTGVAFPPYYLIELYSTSIIGSYPYNCYRVNARGVGSTNNAVVNLQSIYCIQF